MKLARVAFAIVASIAASCAAVAGIEPITFETVTSEPDAARRDVADAPAIDAAADRVAPTGCAADPGHDFCDEFSRALAYGDGGWTANPVSGPATLVRESEAVLATLPAAGSGDSSNFLELVRAWTKQPSGIRPPFVVRARMFVEQCPLWANFVRYFRGTSNEQYNGVIQLRSDRGECYSQLIWVDNRDGGGQGYLHVFERTSVGVWHDIALFVEESASRTTTITYELDGLRSGATVEATNPVDEIFFQIGLQGASAGGRVRFDDVRVDWTAR
jgi:hypothetical protein